MRDYGGIREDNPIDRKRRYANCAPRAGDLREERAAKRRVRAAGKAEIREAVTGMIAARDETPGDGVMRCAPDCPVCNAPESG